MKNILVLILACITFSLKAQPPYIEKRVDVCLAPNTSVWPMCFDVIDGFIYTGCGWKFTNNSISNYNLILSKADSMGNVIWIDTIAGSCFEFIPPKGNIAHSGNNLFYTAFSSSYDGGIENFHGPFDCSTWSSTPYSDILVVKITKDGQRKWSKCYGGQNPDTPCKVFTSKEGNSIVLAGSIKVAAIGDYSNPISAITGSDMWLVEIDTANGNIIREKCFGTTMNEYLFDAIQTKDGGYLLSGTSSQNPQNFRDVFVTKVDSLWNEEWTTLLPTPKEERGALILEDTLTEDIYWLINSNETDSIFNTTHYYTNFEWDDNFNNWLVKLNKNGERLWVKFVGTPFSEDLIQSTYPETTTASIIFNKQHQIVSITTSLTAPIDESGKGIFRFMRIDTTGNILTEKNFQDFLHLNSIISLDNDRYLCLASMLPFNDNCPFQFVTLGNVVGVNEIYSDSDIAIYPNPADNFIEIDLPDVISNAQLLIYNLTGQLITKKQIISNQQIPISELVNGTYIFVIQEGDKVIGRQRMIVAK